MITESGWPFARQHRYLDLVARAWTDAAFKARLLADPKTVLQQAGYVVPVEKQIGVLEMHPDRVFLALYKPAVTSTAWARLVDRAREDPAFRSRLVLDPLTVLEEARIPAPAGVRLEVVDLDEMLGYFYRWTSSDPKASVWRTVELDQAHAYLFLPVAPGPPEGMDADLGATDVAPMPSPSLPWFGTGGGPEWQWYVDPLSNEPVIAAARQPAGGRAQPDRAEGAHDPEQAAFYTRPARTTGREHEGN
jgi:hypothetical protein